MTFLNFALAFGAAAFVIPLVIHILNRSRFRTVEWGAMHLLESVIKVNHKRFQLDQLLLLLVRCAIPVLLALCLARPVLTGSRLLEGDAPVSMVMLLDTSYSMDASDSTGSRFKSAVEAACQIIAATTNGSEVAVILTGGKPTPLFDQPVFDSEAVIRRLRQVQSGYGASNMPEALNEAMAMLSGMSNARRELIVLSDFQAADWGDSGLITANAIRQQVDAMSIKPELTLYQIGSQVQGNVSVDSLEIPQRALGVDQQLAVRANIHNHGTSEVRNARVILRIDGAEASVSQISLAARGTTQTLFPCTFKTSGSHIIEVQVVVDDPLKTDNTFAAAVTVWESIKVVLVDGDPSSQPLKGETDFLSIALTPYTFGRVKLSDLVETQTIEAKEINEELLKTARVIVLANVSKLDDETLELMTNFVNEGGALFVTSGNRIDLTWYRERMYAQGTGLLPLPYGATVGQSEEVSNPSSEGKSSRIVAQHFSHPAMEFFNEAANGDLSKAEIRRWSQMKQTDELPIVESGTTATDPEETQPAEPQQHVVVLARLETGDPLLVERRFGDGVVMQMATACDADWSDLPLRPFYVPLMQQIVTTMASQIAPPRNIQTGEPVVALFSNDSQDGQTHAAALSVTTPDGAQQSITPESQGTLQLARFDETQRPGVYSMVLPSTETIYFVAATSRNESDLSMLSKDKLLSLSKDMAATIISTPAQYLEQDRLRRHGREIWKFVLMGLLALMFLELVLQQRFSRVIT